MFCRHCGKQIEEDSRFCRYCGGNTQVVEQSAAVNAYKNTAKASVKQPASDALGRQPDSEEAEFEEVSIEEYRKILLSPEAKRREALKKKAREKNEKLNKLFRTAVLKHVLAKKQENELDKLGAKNVDLYKRHMKGK